MQFKDKKPDIRSPINFLIGFQLGEETQ